MNTSIQAFQNHTPVLGKNIYIADSARVIGRVTFEDEVNIWPMCVLRGDVNTIHIGARTNVQDGSVLHVSRPTPKNPDGYPLIIEEDVTLGHKVMLHGCTIKAQSLIGMGAIILDGAVIDRHVIVGAGTLVTARTHLESGYLYVGSPAKKVRELRPEEYDYFLQSSANYVKLQAEYR